MRAMCTSMVACWATVWTQGVLHERRDRVIAATLPRGMVFSA